jgi:GNAT superfamily N-acetyltransferase
MTQEEIIIREACLEDSVAIATILRTLDWSEQIEKETPAQTQAHVAERISQCEREQNHTLLVAERRQGTPGGDASGAREVVGYVAVHWFPHLLRGNDGYVSELFVLPSVAGKGIGTLLLDRVHEDAQERGCTQLILMNRRIRESYRRSFYAKRGWEEQADAAFFSLILSPQKVASGQ